MRSVTRLLPVLSLLLLAVPAHAKSASEIFQAALKANDDRLAGIESYTVVQSMMGVEVTTEYVVKEEGGHRIVQVKGAEGEGLDDAGMLYGHLDEMARNAKLEGEESVDGLACWKVRVDGLGEMNLMPSMGNDGPDVEPETGIFWLDKEDLLLRRLHVDGTVTNEGRTGPIRMDMRLGDYRNVDGLVYSFRTSMSITGLSSGMSESDREQARASLEELQTKMAEMPEEQRKMMEQMMGGQIQNLEKMVHGDEMSMEMLVKDVTVNGAGG